MMSRDSFLGVFLAMHLHALMIMLLYVPRSDPVSRITESSYRRIASRGR